MPKSIQRELERGMEILADLCANGGLSPPGREILEAVLVARCESVTAKADLGLPTTSRGWATLAGKVQADIPVATKALELFESAGGKRFGNYLRMAAEEFTTPSRAPAAPGSGQGILEGMALARARRIGQLNPKPGGADAI
ncbi:MAG TPA: hypothetical protein PLJ12_12200 [Planctomycetota bacterium]|nr:hypothetical protein [Planctomycetota bacterium]